MTIYYEVIANSLTDPPSYTARVAPKDVLDIDAMAEAINVANPNIPVATARTTLLAFREEVKTQILSGNTVKLENFVSFVSTLPVRLDNATDPLPTNPLDIKTKPSITFKNEIRQDASFNRAGYPEKDPSIIAALDTNSQYQNLIRNGYGFEIQGMDIGFDATDANQGVFLIGPDGTTETKQDNISWNKPSKIIVQANVPAPSSHDFVENQIKVTTKYTTGGSLKSKTFSKYIRSINQVGITATETEVFSQGETSSSTDITAYTGSTGDRFLLAAVIKPDLTLVLRAAAFADGVYGDDVTVSAAGDYDVVCSLGTITVTVGDFDELYATAEAYQKYIVEDVDITL